MKQFRSRKYLHVIALVTVLVALLSTSCRRDYTSRMAEVLDAMEARNPTLALEALDELIARGEAGKKPEVKNLGLLHLERASILQSMGRFEEAAESLRYGDEITELLDLTPQGARGAAEYFFNDSAKIYHSPIYEKMMINVMAVASYLATGDRQRAMVAGRRIVVMAEYFEGAGYDQHPMLGLSWYVAGLSMEAGGRGNDARLFYRKAVETLDTPMVRSSLEQLGQRRSEVVSLVFAGVGPRKHPTRLPIGLVVGWVNDSDNFGFSNEETELIGQFSAEEMLTWVNFPVLEPADFAYSDFQLRTGSGTARIPLQADVASFALAQWQRDRPAIAWSAVTRALTRIVAREALQATGAAVEDQSAIAGGLLRLGGLIAQGAMQAADIPDTRAWNMMPAGVFIARTPVSPGAQEVELLGRGPYGGVSERRRVEVPDDGFAVVVSRLPN